MEALSKEQLLAILAAARAYSVRNWLMVLMGFSHGLRPTEVTGGWCVRTVNKQKERFWHPGIVADDIRDGHLTVQRLKGSNRTVQPLCASENPLLDELRGVFEFTRGMHGNQRLFPITRQQFGRLFVRYAATAGIPRRLAHPHILKHTIAMQTIHSAGIENVRQYLGHKSISSTGAYLKVSDADAAAVIKKARGD